MKPEQYEHWKDFAKRMARAAMFDFKRGPSREWIEAQVANFFDLWETVPGRTEHLHDWDTWDRGWEGPGEKIADYLECEHPGLSRAERDQFDSGRKIFGRDKWEYLDWKTERWRETWENPVICCIRAGLDMATEPGGGVVGFTVGDLRRMYPDGFPDWLQAVFEEMTTQDGERVEFDRLDDSMGVWL